MNDRIKTVHHRISPKEVGCLYPGDLFTQHPNDPGSRVCMVVDVHPEAKGLGVTHDGGTVLAVMLETGELFTMDEELTVNPLAAGKLPVSYR